jgi:hypothetical protein
MTRIPADTKDAKSPQSPPMPTTNPFPNPILELDFGAHDLRPYSESDAASQSREIPPPPPQKIPESNAINAHSEVHITGPLHV